MRVAPLEVRIDAGIVAPRKAQFDQLPIWLKSLHPLVNAGHLRQFRFRYEARDREPNEAGQQCHPAPLLRRHPKAADKILDDTFADDNRILAPVDRRAQDQN